MATNLTDIIKKVRTALRGEEVRGSIADGLEYCGQISENAKADMEATASAAKEAMNKTASDAKKAIETSAASTKEQLSKDIDAKAAAALKSIPESYTELDGSVKQLKEDLINYNIEESTDVATKNYDIGELILVDGKLKKASIKIKSGQLLSTRTIDTSIAAEIKESDAIKICIEKNGIIIEDYKKLGVDSNGVLNLATNRVVNITPYKIVGTRYYKLPSGIKGIFYQDGKLSNWYTDSMTIPSGENTYVEFAYIDNSDINNVTSFLSKIQLYGFSKVVAGKKILWLGTSIPASGYPDFVAGMLETEIYNKSLGSSIMRIGNSVYSESELEDDLGISGMYFQNVCLSLSMTQKERRKLFDCWTTDGRKKYLKNKGYSEEQLKNVVGYSNLMAGSFAEASTDDSSKGFPTEKPLDVWEQDGKTYKYFREYCYKACWDNSVGIESDLGISGAITEAIAGRIEPFLSGESKVDLVVFDHGRNDGGVSNAKTGVLESLNTYVNVPNKKDDRHFAMGAYIYLVNKIKEKNPNIKIAIIGHYDNDDKRYNIGNTWMLNEKMSDYFGFPLFKLWEVSGIRSNVQITTSGYWDSKHVWHNSGYNGANHVGNNMENLAENPREIDGVWYHDLSLRQIAMWDDTHPASDSTRAEIAQRMSNFISKLLN